MNSPNDASDLRLNALLEWARERLQAPGLYAEPASSDASFRRYFRLTPAPGANTLIAMDAPPEAGDCRPFLKVAGLMQGAGLHVPAILHADLERGFLLLSDLGRQTFLDVLNEDNADPLMSAAIDTLIRWQLASRPDVLPEFDQAFLQRELDLFPNWYVGRHLGLSLDDSQLAIWQDACRHLIRSALAQPRVFMHRDYMPRNLMLSEPNPGVLDFQDAVWGPVSYDIASLLRDAFRSWPEARVSAWAEEYWRKARAANLPVGEDFTEFRRAMDWMGMQRHLKILGLFARIHYRDGKPRYLADTPRFLNYVRIVGSRYPELAPVARLIDALETHLVREVAST